LKVAFSYVTDSPQTRTRASGSAGHGRPADGRLRLLAAAEQLFATRGLEVHQTPIARHRQQLIARLPAPGERTTRQLVEAHVQPLAAEMLRFTPSYWARLTEMLLADQPLWFSRGVELSLHCPGPKQWADSIQSELLELMVAHLTNLPESEAVDRVALTARFLNSGLARWEHDSEAGVDDVAPLAPFTLILTDLAVAMLDAPTSVEV
jgi:hypothetical protein